MGNREGGTATATAADESTYVKIKPDVISWRDITIGESQFQSMAMKEDAEHYGWSDVDTHLMKNSEWGAVAYLCYSVFGSVPQINGNGKSGTNNWYDFHTGAGPKATDNEERYENWSEETYGYNTALGQLASTTGNVYGIYDMSGGAWERVAAYYDNGNESLSTYGKSSNHGESETQYFTLVDGKATIKPEYVDYWEAYEVSTEEKSNSIEVGEEQLTREQLWNASKNSTEAENKRHDLTEETWNNLAEKKGIGMNEVAGSWGYRGLVNGTTIGWKTDPTSTREENGKAWNGDYVTIGGADLPFLFRGGTIVDEIGAGVLRSGVPYGGVRNDTAFRPVLVLQNT